MPDITEENANAAALAEIKRLKQENSKLSRELRVTKSYLDKISRTVEAKEALGLVLSAMSARQKAYTDILLDNCPNIIFLLDDARRFILCTKVFLSITGTHNFDIIRNLSLHEVFSAYLSPEQMEKLEAAMTAVTVTQEPYILNEWIDFGRNGLFRCYSIELMHIGGARGADTGIEAGILAVFVDLTDFMREKDRSEAANNAKSDFLATMSHEIRTPMNAIIGMNEMMERSELDAQQKKYVSDIKRASQSLLSIINDILDFSKIEAGKLELVNANYGLRSLLENLLSMFEMMFTGKGLSLHFDIGDTVPTMVYGDENRLRQILTNLLSNALKYTKAGGARFSAWLSDEGMLRFDIADTGIGIREEDMARLFKPFEQLDTLKNKNVVGTGLGLAISHRLSRLMNGDLWLESEYGRGSTFSLVIPCIVAEVDDTTEKETQPDDFSAPEAIILVVDDIDINLDVAEAMLGAFNIQPTLVQSGAEAIASAKERSYDIIFMDHMMPGMDGLEATKLIRELGGSSATTPIIALTANAIMGAEEMFLQNHFDGYLSKPLELAALNRCLRKWLPNEKIRESEAR